jgi:hypothetical protein
VFLCLISDRTTCVQQLEGQVLWTGDIFNLVLVNCPDFRVGLRFKTSSFSCVEGIISRTNGTWYIMAYREVENDFDVSYDDLPSIRVSGSSTRPRGSQML